MKFFCLFAGLSLSSLAIASESAEILLGIEMGQAKFSGTLTDNDTENFVGFDIMIGGGKKSGSNVFGFFNIPFRTLNTTAIDGDFPFEPGPITISQNGVIPNICYSFGLDLSGCLGFGYSVVRVADKDRKNFQSYGSSSAEVHLGRFSGKGIVGGLNASFITVEQSINSKTSKFEITPLSVFIGYNYLQP